MLYPLYHMATHSFMYTHNNNSNATVAQYSSAAVFLCCAALHAAAAVARLCLHYRLLATYLIATLISVSLLNLVCEIIIWQIYIADLMARSRKLI